MTYQQCDQLDEALTRMETALESPIIPGEIESWLGTVRTTCMSFAVKMQEHFREKHPPAFERISQNDPALMRRIEQMREQENSLRNAMTELLTQLKNLAYESEDMEPDEARARRRLSKVQDDGLDLVLSFRKLELSLSAWLTESQYRDRGIAD